MLIHQVARVERPNTLPRSLSTIGWGGLAVVYGLATLTPILVISALYLMSWRGQELLGHWPFLGFGDSPTFLSNIDSFTSTLFSTIDILLQLVPYGFLVAVFGGFALGYKYVNVWPFLLFGIYTLGWLVLIFEPGSRFFWYINLY